MSVSPLLFAVCSIDLCSCVLAGLRQIRQAADRLQPNVFFHQLRRLFLQETLEQVHQCENFALRALPVFRGKGIESEELDPQIAAAFDAGAHRVGAFLVALDPGQSALLRPAAVAIHDDGDVPRDRFRAKRFILLEHERLAAGRADADHREAGAGQFRDATHVVPCFVRQIGELFRLLGRSLPAWKLEVDRLAAR